MDRVRAPGETVNSILIQEALAPLVGLPLRRLGRAADLLWVQFGEMRELPDRRGGTRWVGEWALHVQCPWRLTRPPAILLARGDCFYEADSGDPYDWNAGGESRFDRCAAPLNREFESSPPQVETVAVDEVGGFTLRLSGDLVFEVFPDECSGTDAEHWRFFQPGGDGPHVVFPEDESR
jgi:hypothetical protein